MFIQFCFCLLTIYKGLATTSSNNCNTLINGNLLYTLEPLARKDDYKDYFLMNGKETMIVFNFCARISQTCNGEYPYAALFYKEDKEEKCISLTTDSLFITPEFTLLNPKDPLEGIIYEVPPNFDKEDQPSIIVTVKCNRKLITEFRREFISFNSGVLSLEISSLYGCPILEISSLWKFIEKNWLIVFLLLAGFGFILCFFGLTIFHPTIFFIGFLSGFAFFAIFVGDYLVKPYTHYSIIILLLVISVIVGGFSGYFFVRLPRLGIVGVCIWSGILISFILNTCFFSHIETNPPNLILFMLILGFSAIFGVIGFLYWKRIIIIVTSLNGGYCMSRGISLVLGGFPNELTISTSLKYKQYESVPWTFYFYLFLMFAFAFYGAKYQFKRHFVDNMENIDEDFEILRGSNMWSSRRKQSNRYIPLASQSYEK